MANTARITQSTMEVLTGTTGVARITQSAIEVLVGLGISCAAPPSGMVNSLYAHTFLAGSGDPPYTFSVAAGALPTGISLAPASGIASGTPTTAGTFTFTIQVADSLGAIATAPCSITIGAQATTIAPVTGGAMSRCQVNKAKPRIITRLDWSSFQRELERQRPPDVEEVRISRFEFLGGTIRRNHG